MMHGFTDEYSPKSEPLCGMSDTAPSPRTSVLDGTAFVSTITAER